MARHERSISSAFYGGWNKVTDEPVSIIDEYLALIREKLPESISDDVITELQSYMVEAARDLGDNNEITLESAKKVVAQFGAPGEVADEYRYSMLPETIPEEAIPTEIMKDTGMIDRKQQAKEPEKTPPRELGVDPTTKYSTFFFKSFSLTVIWAAISSVITSMTGPIWFPEWLPIRYPDLQLIFIVIQITFVTLILLAHTLFLKRNKIILWKRTYPDWSIFQNLVTLPENSVPDPGINLKRLDIAASFVGLLLFTPMILVSNDLLYILIGISGVILLISRIMIIISKLDREKDPSEQYRYEFGINFSLLVILNSSAFWLNNVGLFNNALPLLYYIHWLLPISTIFGSLFGTVLLFQVLTGAQNLWWKTEDLEMQPESQPIEDIKLGKEAIKKDMARNAVSMFVQMLGGLLIFNSIIFYACLEIAPDYNIGVFGSRMSLFLGTTIVIGFLVTLYFLFRYFLIEHLNSTSLIGRRTRVEAVCDLALCAFLLFGISHQALHRYSSEIIDETLHYYNQALGISYDIGWSIIVLEIISVLLVFIGLVIRIPGNILEFKTEYKISAAKRIEESGFLIIVALSFVVGGEFIKYLVTNISHFMNYFYPSYLIIVIVIAFQVVSSGMKVKEMTNAPVPMKTDEHKNINEMNEHAKIAN